MIEWTSLVNVVLFPLAFVLFLTVGYVWGFFSICLHETGHAIAAYLVGSPAYCVEIGKGIRIMYSFTIFSVNIVIKLFPFSGFTWHPLLLQKGGWWRGVVIALSGVMIDVMLFLVAFYLSFLAIALRGTPFVLVVLAPVGFQFSVLFANLFPRNIIQDGEQMPNDTKRAWQYLTGTYRKIIHERVAQLKNAAREYTQSAEPPDSWGLFDNPTLLSQFLLSLVDYHHEQYQRARQKHQLLLATGKLNPFECVYILDMLTSLELARKDESALNDASKWNEEARSILPSSSPLQNTYGAILVARKEYDLGIEHLEGARPLLHKPKDLKVNTACLALAYEQLGDADRAEFWKEQLKTIKVKDDSV